MTAGSRNFDKYVDLRNKSTHRVKRVLNLISGRIICPAASFVGEMVNTVRIRAAAVHNDPSAKCLPAQILKNKQAAEPLNHRYWKTWHGPSSPAKHSVGREYFACTLWLREEALWFELTWVVEFSLIPGHAPEPRNC